MTVSSFGPAGPIAPQPQNDTASVEEWIDWYWAKFLPGWVHRARDPEAIGFFDLLDSEGRPAQTTRRTLLAQARLLFTFSHLALLSDTPAYHDAARTAHDALAKFRKAPGLYRRAVQANGQPTDTPDDHLATSYDQSFVVLGLATWGRLHPSADLPPELEACWSAVET